MTSATPPPTPPRDEDLTPDEIRVLLTDHLIEVRRLAALLPPPPAPAADPTDFSDIETPPPTGEMHTARDSDVVKTAQASLRAAAIEVGFAEAVITVVDEIAAILGVEL